MSPYLTLNFLKSFVYMLFCLVLHVFLLKETCKLLSLCAVFCEPGKERTGGQCLPCERGYYKNNDNNVFMDCTLCPPEYVTPTTESTSLADCSVSKWPFTHFLAHIRRVPFTFQSPSKAYSQVTPTCCQSSKLDNTVV